MTSKYRGRQDHRPVRPLKPEERAGLLRAALEYRAAWRAERAGTENGQVGKAEPQVRKEQRARFAAAVARAEFGRFYWKAPAAGPTRPRNKRPRPNGARPV